VKWGFVNRLSVLKKPVVIIFLLILLGSLLLSFLAYRIVIRGGPASPQNLVPSTSQAKSTSTPLITPTANPKKTTLPVQSPDKILGIEGSVGTNFPGVSWVRLGYPSCGWGDLSGNVLKNTIESYHQAGIRVLLTVCQGRNDNTLFDTAPLKDAAAGNEDAVQCGNEEMKQDASVSFLYIPPDRFARFYDLCEHAIHTVRSDVPVLLGSLDPHVGGVDYQPLVDQANYLDQMQSAMNSSVHPGGNWDWHNQTLGLIDSWHNGYPDASVNSLAGLFSFWAQQFNVDLNSGQLGKHLWVVEGTGCFKGCGLDENSHAQVAIAHILTLIADVQTVTRYKVPFFYFTGEDFYDQGVNWPIGVLTGNGQAKPIRQDLSMGARHLTLSCPTGSVSVVDQLQLLAKMYSHCTLPTDYYNIITS
jgi:hypothetical protein